MTPMLAYCLVVIHYRNPASVAELIDEALDSWTSRPDRIIVVDNSGDMPRSKFEIVVTLNPGRNIGYGPAVNLAIQHAISEGFRSTLVATQDLRMTPSSASELLGALWADGELALTAPLLAYREEPERVFSAGGELTPWGQTRHPHQGWSMSRMSATSPYEVDWADGACLAVKNEPFERIGGFDESYFLYVEEVDLQLRLRQLGARIAVVPSAIAYQSPGNYTRYLKHRNLTYFTRKYPDSFHHWPWIPVLAKDSLKAILNGQRGDLFWGIRGYIDGRRRAMGPPPKTWWTLKLSKGNE